MIAGFGGDLISHSYIEQLLANRGIDRHAVAAFERQLARWWRLASRSLGPASSTRAVADTAIVPLLQLLGYERPSLQPESFGLASMLAETHAVIVAVPWAESVSSPWRDAIRIAAAAGARWALVSNGRQLRIIDCLQAWSRASIDFDLGQIAATSNGITTLWLLAHGDALRGDEARSLRTFVDQSTRHANGVCRALGQGVLASLPRLAQSLHRTHHAAGLDQALTLIYRMLFLLFAEARGLVPTWNEVYREAYTMDALVRRAFRPSSTGAWKALQAISRLAHSGCHAGDLVVTAFNGRLFSPRAAPLVEQRVVPDAIVNEVLIALATEATTAGRRRISYYDLGVEQLGSVYERVLEHQPSRRGSDLVLERTSIQRKATGSFYTPQALTEFLVRRTLEPLVRAKTAEQILDLRVLDPAMGSGAFLVAACRYLAEQCEVARVKAGEWSHGDVTERDRASLRRDVAERCLYGVDLNATAVQLARLSLWLTTLAADRPLTFLDHHLAVGNSLIGARLADLSQPPQRCAGRASTLPLFEDALADDVATHVLPARLRLAIERSDSLDAVRTKERLFAQLTAADGPLAKWKRAADLWCAAALSPGQRPAAGVVREWIASATGAPTTLPESRLRESITHAIAMASAHTPFHWELAFPEVFLNDRGQPSSSAGFDALIGNPPWDVLRADAGSASERNQARSVTAAAMRFYRTSRSFDHQGTGHANRYQLFLDRALQLTRPAGRIGLLLPSGIAIDHGSAALRRRLFDRTTIDTWIGFDNRRRIFPIHRSVRFVLLSLTNSGATDALRFRCGVTDPAMLHRHSADGEMLTISRGRLQAWDPEHLTIPEVPDATALGIISAISDRVPALSAKRGWNARFGRELNATDDRPHFEKRNGRSLLPIVEGKQLSPFRVDLDRSSLAIARKTASSLLDAAMTFDRARIAYRDVASATNKLTLIAAMLPAGTVSTHTVFCLKTPLDERSQWCLLALMNSLVANYLVRLHVTTHVTASLMSRLPIPRPAPDSCEFNRLTALAQSLAASGIPDGSAEYAELNAIAARLYGMTRDQFSVVLDSFPLIDAKLRARCLEAF